MQAYFGGAKATGIKREEIEAVEAIVVAVSGGRVRAQFREARRKAQESGREHE